MPTTTGPEEAPDGTDWRSVVREEAAKSGIDLPPSTIDELATHLEDLYQAERSNAGDGEEARRRVRAVLESSPLELLVRAPTRDPQRSRTRREAEDLARTAARGRGVQVTTSVRMALRQFLHHPSFAILAILVMGLGIGAAATIYTVLESVVLRPLPYREPDRLVTIWDTNLAEGRLHDAISPVNFSDQRELPAFEDAAAWWRPGVNLTDPGLDPIRVDTIEVSGNLFDLLGVRPQVGAGFPEAGPLFVPNELIAVISDRLWRSRYGADPSIIAKPLRFNDTPYTVVGVMPKGFHFPDEVDVWQRLSWDMTQHSRRARFMEAVARLSPGTGLEEAQAAIDSLWSRLEKETADFANSTGSGWGSRLIPLLEEQLGYYRPALFVLFGAVGLLLVIGVLNVATLLLTRALSREREVALRVAMGASPGQVLLQLIVESLVLSLGAALVGLAATAAALPLLVHLAPVEIPRLAEASVGWTTFGVGLGIAAITTIFFGLTPALVLLRREVTTDLKSGERGSSRGARRFYSVLVAAEVALAAVLLTSSALLVRTVQRMVGTPTGVNAEGVLTTVVQLGSKAYADWDRVGEIHSRIVEAIREQPGVEAVGATNFLPFGIGWRTPFWIPGTEPPARIEDLPQAQMHSVSDGYFEAMGVTLAAGRTFAPSDRPDGRGVVIVNESFALQYLPEGVAVGSLLEMHARGIGPLGRNLLPDRSAHELEIVGIVRDIRNAPLGQPVEPAFYVPTRQFPFREQFLAVRAVDSAAALAAIRTALRDVTPDIPMGAARTWEERLAERSAEPRLLMTVLIFFGALAALLASLGVYGLFSWSVALRRRELAIRLTLGAEPARVARLIFWQSGLLVAVGLLTGLAIVRLSQGVLARVLFEVSPADLGSTAAASGLLVLTALGASVPVALRAMSVDPVEGLRVD